MNGTFFFTLPFDKGRTLIVRATGHADGRLDIGCTENQFSYYKSFSQSRLSSIFIKPQILPPNKWVGLVHSLFQSGSTSVDSSHYKLAAAVSSQGGVKLNIVLQNESFDNNCVGTLEITPSPPNNPIDPFDWAVDCISYYQKLRSEIAEHLSSEQILMQQQKELQNILDKEVKTKVEYEKETLAKLLPILNEKKKKIRMLLTNLETSSNIQFDNDMDNMSEKETLQYDSEVTTSEEENQ